MFLRPILNSLRINMIEALQIKGSRNVRTVVKMNKHTFKLSVDVRNFKKHEIRVKARPQYVIIEGKQERKTDDGYVLRKFIKKYKLPTGCDPENMKSTLSGDGILTITAQREYCEKNFPCESIVPISHSVSKDEDCFDDSFVRVENIEPPNPCDPSCMPPEKSTPDDKKSEDKSTKPPKC